MHAQVSVFMANADAAADSRQNRPRRRLKMSWRERFHATTPVITQPNDCTGRGEDRTGTGCDTHGAPKTAWMDCCGVARESFARASSFYKAAAGSTSLHQLSRCNRWRYNVPRSTQQCLLQRLPLLTRPLMVSSFILLTEVSSVNGTCYGKGRYDRRSAVGSCVISVRLSLLLVMIRYDTVD